MQTDVRDRAVPSNQMPSHSQSGRRERGGGRGVGVGGEGWGEKGGGERVGVGVEGPFSKQEY